MFVGPTCGRIRRLLWDFAQRCLPEQELERVEQHLRSCPRCAGEAASYQRSVDYLRDFGDSAVPQVSGTWAAIRERLAVEPARGLRAGPFRYVGAVLAACALIALVAVYQQHRSTPRGLAAKPGIEAARATPQERQQPGGLSGGVTGGRPDGQLPGEREPDPRRRASRQNDALRAPAPRPAQHDGLRSQKLVQRAVQSNHGVPEPVRVRERAPRHVTAPPRGNTDDLDYMNANLELVLHRWVPSASAAGAARAARAPVGKTDDFIYVEPPRIASTNPGAVRPAAEQYQRDRAIVDARLERKISLGAKGISLSDLCSRVTDETGVHLRAGRAVADEKITLFCEKQSLRDIMRQISHLFGYRWARSGEEGAYRYELFQDLRAQLAEEELRNRDVDAALIALDEAMGAYKPFLQLSAEEIQRKLRELPNGDKNRALLRNAADGSFAAIEAYMRLTPAEVQVLRSGGEVKFSTDDELPPGFPSEWARRLLDSFRGLRGPAGEIKVTSSTVSLSLDHTELGAVALNSFVSGGGVGFQTTLAVGRSPSASNPENRSANKNLQSDPLFRRRVTLAPKGCVRPDFKTAFGIDFSKGRNIRDDLQDSVSPPDPHLSSADVWEEVHAKTGIPIIGDYYTHLYPANDFAAEKQALFDALCRSGDALGVLWKKDADFVQCRSTAFFWNKLKEVPNRLLDRWQMDRELKSGLPLDDLLEMAELSDRQLDSLLVGQGVKHCRDLMEWSILADPQYAGSRRKLDQVRPLARFLATLPPGLRQRALAPDGVPLSAFGPPQLETLARIFYLDQLLPQIRGTPQDTRLRVDYVPSGMYTWRVVYDSDEDARAARRRVPVCVGETPEKALAAARKFYPRARSEDIHRSYGMLTATFIGPDGDELACGQFQAAVRINP